MIKNSFSSAILDGHRDTSSLGLIDDLRALVGDPYVIADLPGRALHSRTTEPTERQCRVIVRPETAAEVSALLRLAAQHRTPIWPFSGGHNWGYGTKNALRDGAIILLLDRMNRILEVDDELGYAVIEPGVTQQQLSEYLAVHHPRLIADCTDSTPHGSVLGNAIERGYGYTPYGDHFAHLCGLDVILPSGERLRTGSSDANCPTRHIHRWGSGPFIEGLFSQSNLGVVVQGGIWLRPRPEAVELFILDVETAQLARAVDGLRRLALDGIQVSHVHMTNAFQTLSVLQPYPAESRRRGQALTSPELATLATRYGLPAWTAIGGLYGTREVVRAQRHALRRALAGCGTLSFFDRAKVARAGQLVSLWQRGGVARAAARAIKSVITPKAFELVALLPELLGLLEGRPTWRILQSAYFKSESPPAALDLDPARDGCGLLWLAPALPMQGAHAETLLGQIEPLFAGAGFNLSACLTMMNARTLFLLLGIFFDPQNADEVRRADQLYRDLYALLARGGYQHYRGGVPAWAMGADKAPPALLGQIKELLDPTRILAPGRYGL